MNQPFAPIEVAAFARRDLMTFLHAAFRILRPTEEFVPNWHLELIVDRLIAVAEGRIKRLIINVPPRTLKSVTVSVAFVAWVLGRHPSWRIICASYGQELADNHARDTRRVMLDPFYQRVFSTRLASDRMALNDFQTTRQGGRMATSVGGVLTGRGGNILIIDDPVKPYEAFSKSIREGVNHWYDNTLYSRLDDKQEGAIVIVMQRVHQDDLVGHVLEKEHWEVLSLPAIAPEDQVYEYSTIAGPVRRIRRAGELLHPTRESLASLQAIRATMGEFAFAAQYQQTPVPAGGALVKTEWLRYYEMSKKPQEFDAIVQSWDTANTVSELADYSVCTTWGRQGHNVYLLDVFRKRLNYPDLKRAVRDQAQAYSATTVLIEDKASGTQLIQELLHEGLYHVKGVKPVGDKVMRMHAQTAMIENGFVYFPDSALWIADYVRELTGFPNAKFDDQVDSTAQALAWIAEEGREPGILAYYRMQAEKAQRGEL